MDGAGGGKKYSYRRQRFFIYEVFMHRYALVLATALVSACSAQLHAASRLDEAKVTLAADDGWAALQTGTTGGANAVASQIYVVRSRSELIAALNDGEYPARKEPSNNPKIVIIDRDIDANVDDDNRPLSCKDYARDGYTIEAFVAAYDPATWGKKAPSGQVEAARRASQEAQEQRVRIRVGSNTTIFGDNATLRGASLDIKNQTNVIVRNIAFKDTHDCFPQWEPDDGNGAWNSEYDFISVRGSSRVWIDHNLFDDGSISDDGMPHYFGKHYQVHDGAVDITEGSDLVTVSWNRFLNHEKVMLIGSSDSRTADSGKLRVTLHHNLFENVGQRMPRVRYGQVHVYNNLYRVDAHRYQYSWGVGTQSQVYAENNALVSPVPLAARRVARVFKGEMLHASGTTINDIDVDVVADSVTKLKSVEWRPTLHGKIDLTRDVAKKVAAGSGPVR
jgi:pectate lyase